MSSDQEIHPLLRSFFSRSIVPALLASSMFLTACATTGSDFDQPDGVFDPYETTNRKIHAFNRGLDKAIVRPASQGYTKLVPDDIEDSVGYFATNLGRPSDVVNGLLQGDFRGAGLSTARFLVNSTLGIGGLFDVAGDFGIEDHETDFGQTLSTWGSGEGAFIELPFLGPSTQRDAAGKVVDLFTNPLSYVLDDPESYYGPVASVGSGLGTRGRFTDTIDSILYDSADSYAQARLIYLQNRRFELGEADAGTQIDPFELDTSGF